MFLFIKSRGDDLFVAQAALRAVMEVLPFRLNAGEFQLRIKNKKMERY
jgi:hypothetical protein